MQEEYEGLIISDDDLEIDEADKNVDNKLINLIVEDNIAWLKIYLMSDMDINSQKN